MSNEIRCPECGSTNVECDDGEVHRHRCHDCGYSTPERSLDDILRDMAEGGADDHDPRLPYVTVQIDRDDWDQIVEWAQKAAGQ